MFAEIFVLQTYEYIQLYINIREALLTLSLTIGLLYRFVDFFQNWNFFYGFLYLSLISPGGNYIESKYSSLAAMGGGGRAAPSLVCNEPKKKGACSTRARRGQSPLVLHL